MRLGPTVSKMGDLLYFQNIEIVVACLPGRCTVTGKLFDAVQDQLSGKSSLEKKNSDQRPKLVMLTTRTLNVF